MRGMVVACILVVGLSVNSASAAAKLRAFVVGIDGYTHLPKLARALNDARAVATALKSRGFDVKLELNPTLETFEESLIQFSKKLKPEDISLFYFAGHGIQVDGLNYILMKDSKLTEKDLLSDQRGAQEKLKWQAFNFHEIMERLEEKSLLASVYILDACRDNPFIKVRSKKRSGRKGAARGLAPIESVFGAFVLYSAAPDQQAMDSLGASDTDPNSPYTRNLLRVLKDETLSLVEVAKRVQVDVQKEAKTVNHEQRPAYFDGILGNFYMFNKKQPFAGGGKVDLSTNERVFLLGQHAQWRSSRGCRPHAPPRIKVVNKPKYGRIVIKYDKRKVSRISRGNAKCKNTTQRYVNIYYITHPEYTESSKREKVKIETYYNAWYNGHKRLVEYNIDIREKAAPYRVLRSR